MAATYRGRLGGSTGGGARRTALLLLLLPLLPDLPGCATAPGGEGEATPVVRYAFVARTGGRAPAVLRQDPGGAWRIERGVLEEDRRDTPRRTLQAFIRAMEQADYVALRSLAPGQLREGMTLQALKDHVEADPEGSADLLDRLKAHVDAPISLEGDQAQMRYAGAVFEMRFEDGCWVVVDPD